MSGCSRKNQTCHSNLRVNFCVRLRCNRVRHHEREGQPIALLYSHAPDLLDTRSTIHCELRTMQQKNPDKKSKVKSRTVHCVDGDTCPHASLQSLSGLLLFLPLHSKRPQSLQAPEQNTRPPLPLQSLVPQFEQCRGRRC